MKKIDLFRVAMGKNAGMEVAGTLNSGYIGEGPQVAEFERRLSNGIGKPTLCVNSGTTALTLAYHLYKDLPGTEVLSTPLTCLATNLPLKTMGFKVKWIDIDPQTLNVSVEDLRRKISPQTKFIVVVHLGGTPCDLNAIRGVQDECYRLYGNRPPIIEDAAQAFASVYDNKVIGTHGNIVCYSFQAIKHLTTSDGGAMTIPDPHLYERTRLLRWFGLDRTKSDSMRCLQIVHEAGYKNHMTDVAATIGMCNLPLALENIEKTRANAAFYDAAGLPAFDHKGSSFWLYTIKVANKDSFKQRMEAAGITVSEVQMRNDHQPCFKDFWSPLPGLDSIADQYISIPVGWWLTREDTEYIVKKVKESI